MVNKKNERPVPSFQILQIHTSLNAAALEYCSIQFDLPSFVLQPKFEICADQPQQHLSKNSETVNYHAMVF
jgi:hypothetical protein